MRAVVGCLAALGLLLIFNGVTDPRPSRRRWFVLLDELAMDAGLPKPAGLILFSCGLAACALASIVSLVVTASAFVATGAGLVAGCAVVARTKTICVRRRLKMSGSWPDALASIIAGVRAGMALPECCQALAERGPEDMQPAFRSFASTYAATASFDTALRRLQDELRDPIADRVVAVLSMTDQVGGNDVVRVLRAMAEMIREDARIRNEVRARWSWTLTASKVAAVSPFIVLVLMSLRPEGALAYRSSGGITTIAIGTIATVIGYRLMLRAARLPEDQRLRP